MGGFANSMLSIMLGWVRGAAATLWKALYTSEGSGFLQWLGSHWVGLTILLCGICTVVDVVIYLCRWHSHKVWLSFFRRLKGRKQQKNTATTKRKPPKKNMVQREWVYPDGSMRTEEVEASALPQEPEWTIQPLRVAEERLNGQQFSPVPNGFVQPQSDSIPGYPGYAEPEPAPPVSEPVVQQEPKSRSKRMMERVKALPLSFLHDDEDLQLHYQPAPPARDKREAFHEPVYPPTWRPPAESESSSESWTSSN